MQSKANNGASRLIGSLVMQACRGTKFDDGVDMNVADAKGFMDVEPQFSLQKIPSEADFLIAYSVVPGEGFNRTHWFHYVIDTYQYCVFNM